jgi:hypothetical protein
MLVLWILLITGDRLGNVTGVLCLLNSNTGLSPGISVPMLMLLVSWFQIACLHL